MRSRALFLFAMGLLMFGCTDGPTAPEGYGSIMVVAFDAPPPPNVQNIFLRIEEVSVHKSGAGWVTLAEPDTTYDFLDLINGTTAVIADTALEAGDYTQLRLILADSNTIVVDGVTHPLVVPSGEETGVKLNLNFTVLQDELIEIYVDFDAGKSVRHNANGYTLQPTFKTFKSVLSGTVAGAVRDTLGVGILHAAVEAVNAATNDTTTTLTDSTGAYQLVLLEGTYDITASAQGYAISDTAYAGVYVQAMADLLEYDFVMQ